jgi:hypothetical protein
MSAVEGSEERAVYAFESGALTAVRSSLVPKTNQLVEKVGVESGVVSKQYRYTSKTPQNWASLTPDGGQKGARTVFQQPDAF